MKIIIKIIKYFKIIRDHSIILDLKKKYKGYSNKIKLLKKIII